MIRRINVYPVLFMLVFLLSMSVFVSAAGAANGDGTGGGKNNPLILESSIPADGQKDIKDLKEIKLCFSKNVVYMTVREANQKCCSLWANGQQIPVEVIMADDQIEREKRRDIVLKPLQPLLPGTDYTVKIAPGLEAKSGATLGSEHTVHFKTAVAKSQASEVTVTTPAGIPPVLNPAAAPEETGDSDISKNSSDQQDPSWKGKGIKTAGSNISPGGANLPTPIQKADKENDWKTPLAILALITIAAAVWLIYRYRRRT